MDREVAALDRVVHGGIVRGESFEDEHVGAVQHGQLSVLTHHGMHAVQCGEGGLPESAHGGRELTEFPEP